MPEASAVAQAANHLPHYLTPILGRERAVVEIARFIATSPLVTIVGAGGIGKTRLAVQVVTGLVGEAEDGTWFVDLAPLTNPSPLAATIANALGLEIGESGDPAAALAAELAARRALILLDNCEHLIEPCSRLLRSILPSCPNVRVLATSREPLGVAGEVVYRLDSLGESACVALFAERARQVDSTFELTSSDVPIVTDICGRLDGIALAIELAAARAPLLPLATLLARLDERFRLLANDSHTPLPQKHQTLRALIDWSYELLSVEHKNTFRRLGVFSGGFSLEAASRVAGYDVAATDVAERLTGLVDKSMLVFSSTPAPRYRMLESIRQYAARTLREHGDADPTRSAYAAYYAELSAEAASRFGVDSEETWLARYEPDLDNFRSALEWALPAQPTLAATIVGNLSNIHI